MTPIELGLLYRNETGCSPAETEVQVQLRKGDVYLLDIDMGILRRNSDGDGACFFLINRDYYEWLQEKLQALL